MDKKQFELQKSVRDSSEDLKNTLNDLYKWTKEIKEKEKAQQDDLENNEVDIPPIRSHAMKPSSSETVNRSAECETNDNPKTNDSEITSPTNPEPSAKELANISKEKGNSLVKLGQHEDAIYFYSEAILHYPSDPVFFTNRALCFLRLEKYYECIEDCNAAIKIDPKCIKAFYRRMQAYETLGEVEKSLADCNVVLSLDAGNLDARKSLDRIKKRKNSFSFNLTKSFQNIRDGTKVLEPNWTQIDGYMKEVPVVVKAPHLRSKKPIKRIPVEEVLTDDTHLNNIPNEVIDKLFNSNDCGSFMQIESKEHKTTEPENQTPPVQQTQNTDAKKLSVEKEKPLVRKKETMVMPKPRKIASVPDAPKTQAEFYATWKELTKQQKYVYLKQIEPTNILKILGAGFEIDTLSEILLILSEFYISDKCNPSLIFEIGKHDEIAILSMFLSDKDHLALKQITEYLRQNGSDDDKIAVLNAKFGVRY